jgi:hypothetical protein
VSYTSTESQVFELLSKWIQEGRPDLEGLGSTETHALSCPAASDTHGDEVFAVFDENSGELEYFPVAIVMPDIAKDNLDLNRFATKNRLAGMCLTTGCQHWQGACRLGHFVNSVKVNVRNKSQHCAITDKCRWLEENGPTICRACSSLRNLPLLS